MTREQQEEIRRLRNSGEGYKRIAAMLGLSVNTVKSFCQRDNVKQAGLNLDHTELNATCFSQENATGEGVCLRCGKPIVQNPGRRKRLYCSDACRMGYWRSQAKPMGEIRRCAGCGKVLLGHDRSRIYCCHACYIAHRFGSNKR
jgi:endogenous inhibitor of DNA gyrase (YacG/DUF329 family)